MEVEYGRTALGVSGGAGGGGDAGGEAGICEKNSSQNTAGTSRQAIHQRSPFLWIKVTHRQRAMFGKGRRRLFYKPVAGWMSSNLDINTTWTVNLVGL